MNDLTSLARERVEERARCKVDRLYLAEQLGLDFTEETHKELFDTYPEFDEKLPWASQFPKRDFLVLWQRGAYKSTAVMVVIAIQAILVNPDIRILFMQGSILLTQARLKEVAAHFTGLASRSRLKELFPEYCGSKKVMKFSKNFLTTPARKRKQLAQATITVASPDSLATGSHFDMGIFDDLIHTGNYRSSTLLAKAQEDFEMAMPLIDPGCPRFVSGTRYAWGDLYEVIIRKNKGEWIISLKTCWNDDGSVRFPQHTTPDGRVVGFTKEFLLQVMRDSPAIYASQYMNTPALESMQVITKAELEAACIPPDLFPALSQASLFVDLATTGSHDNDDCVIYSGRMDARGVIYLVDGRGGQWNASQLALNLIEMALIHRPLKIMIEQTPSAKYFVDYLRMVCKERSIFLPLDYIKIDSRAGAKAIRIQAMAGHVRGNRLKFALGLTIWEKFVEQTIQYDPAGRRGHDDYPDTAGLMCNAFAPSYLLIPNPSVMRSKNPFINLLEQAPAMVGIEPEKPNELGTMGDEFS